EGTLTQGPWHVFHHHAVLSALDPSGCIQKIRGQTPQRYKLKPPLGQPIVAGGALVALRALAFGAFSRSNLDFNPGSGAGRLLRRDQTARMIDEALVSFDKVEQDLQVQVHNSVSGKRRAQCGSSSSRSSPNRALL